MLSAFRYSLSILAISAFAIQSLGAADAPLGGIQLLPGYTHRPLQGIDSIVGEIIQEDGLKISYEIGHVSKPGGPQLGGGFRDRPKLLPQQDKVWYREQTINGQPVHLALSKSKALLISYPLKGMNFRATIQSAEQFADAMLMLLTYPLEQQDAKDLAQTTQEKSEDKAPKPIARDYVNDATLSKAEEQIVIELAQKRGIKQIAKISTYYLLPTSLRGINVQGAEIIQEREASFQVLNVKRQGWSNPNEGPREGDLQLGDFWAGKPTTRKQTILKVGGKEYRTNSVQGLTVAECESILEKFTTGKYVVAPEVRVNVNEIGWNKPQGFRKRGEMLSISFLHKREGSGFFDLECTLAGEKLTVNQIFQAVP